MNLVFTIATNASQINLAGQQQNFIGANNDDPIITLVALGALSVLGALLA